MEERDYFKRQIDLLGKVLGKLLTELICKKSSGEITDGIEITPLWIERRRQDKIRMQVGYIYYVIYSRTHTRKRRGQQ